MNQQQRNDLHSVIAQGLTSLHGQKWVLEGKITHFEKQLLSSSDHDRQNLTNLSLATLKAELEDVNNKLEIGTQAMLELEGVSTAVRGVSDIFMGDASELQDELTGVFGLRFTQIFVDEGETK